MKQLCFPPPIGKEPVDLLAKIVSERGKMKVNYHFCGKPIDGRWR